MSDTMTPAQVLALPMQANDAEAATIREYLARLLRAVWDEGEGFSGKRPFGNSGWEHELWIPLLKAGAIDGSLDSDGYVEWVDKGTGRALIDLAIDALVEPASTSAPGEGHDHDTLDKVYGALTAAVGKNLASDCIREMQNAGILFRERVPC